MSERNKENGAPIGEIIGEEIAERLNGIREQAEEKGEISRLALEEAWATYKETLSQGDDEETAKKKAIDRIVELTNGEDQDIASYATERFLKKFDVRPEETHDERDERIEAVAEEEAEVFKKALEQTGNPGAAREQVIESFRRDTSGLNLEETIAAERIMEEKLRGPEPKKRSGKRESDAEIAEKVKRGEEELQRENQKEQIPLAAERLQNQKAKLEEILKKPELAPEKIQSIQEALKEIEALLALKERIEKTGELVSKEAVERFWDRVEKNFDIISEELFVPENLPVVRGELVKPVRDESTPSDTPRVPSSQVEEPVPTPVEKPPAELEGRGQEEDIAALREQAQKLGMAFSDQVSVEEIKKRMREKVERSATGQKYEKLDDITVLREQAQKLGMAFSDQVSAEDIKKHLREKLEFENTQGKEEEVLEEKPVDVPPAEPSAEEEIAAENKEAAESALTKQDISKEVIEAISKIEKALDGVPSREKEKALEQVVEALPPAEKEKLGAGLWGLNFTVKKWTSETIAKIISAGGKRVEKKSAVGRLLEAASDSYKNEAEDAQQRLDKIAEEKISGRLIDQKYLITSLMRYGRTASDFLGWTAASPLKFVTLGAMAAGRSADILKEARLKNEKVIQKTRVQDIDEAADEAIKIYEAAGGIYDPTLGGDGVSKENLAKAYQEKLPEDLLKRLRENPDPEVSSKIAQKIFRWHIEKTASNVQKKITKIESDSNLSEKEQSAQKQTLLNKYSKRLKDFDRIVSQYGEVDALAMAGRYGEMASKGIVYGVMGESLILGVERLWGHVAEITADNFAIEETESRGVSKLRSMAEEHNNTTRQVYGRSIGINLEDGLTEDEVKKIADKIAELRTAGKEDTAKAVAETYGHLKTSDTGRSVIEIIGEREETIEAPAPSDASRSVPSRIEEAESSQVEGLETAPTPETKPSHFENIIDSAKVEGSDSTWKSTQELFMQNRRQMDYDVSKDGLPSEWANKRTAELMKEYADAHGGKTPELVHNGDKVVVEMGSDNKYHLKVVDAGGKEIEPQALPHKVVETEAPTPLVVEGQASPEKPELEIKGFKNEAPPELKFTLNLDDTNQVRTLVQKTLEETLGTIDRSYQDHLEDFAYMFNSLDLKADVLTDVNKLIPALENFEDQLRDSTRYIVDGQFTTVAEIKNISDETLRNNPPIPVLDSRGNVFYAAPHSRDKFALSWIDNNGQEHAAKWTRRFRKDITEFSVKELREVLGVDGGNPASLKNK